MEAGVVGEIQGIARFKFHEDKVEEFRHVSAQCMEIVRAKDTGTLQYEIYLNDDESEALVLERYRDSESLIEHLANLGAEEIAYAPVDQIRLLAQQFI